MLKRLPPNSPTTPEQPGWSTRVGSPLREPPADGARSCQELPSHKALEATRPQASRSSQRLPAARALLRAALLAPVSALLRAALLAPVSALLRAALLAPVSTLLRAALLAPERLCAALAAATLSRPRAVMIALLLGLGSGFVAEQLLVPVAVAAQDAAAPAAAAAQGARSAVPEDPVLVLLGEKLARRTAALERWRALHGRYPHITELDTLDAGARNDAPGSLGPDPWGRPIAYLAGHDGYLLRSLGADGEPSADDVVVLVEGGRAIYRGLL